MRIAVGVDVIGVCIARNRGLSVFGRHFVFHGNRIVLADRVCKEYSDLRSRLGHVDVCDL